MTTVGISPKAIAAAVTAYLAPIIVGYLANELGVDVEASTATALLGPLVLAGVTFAAAYLAKAGLVNVDPEFYPDPATGPNPPAKVNPDAGVHTNPNRKKAA